MIEKIARVLIERIGSPWPYEEMDPVVRSLWQSHARAVIQALMEPTRKMIEAGNIEAENQLDSDWDSGSDGESYNTYTHLRSDAAKPIFQAMLKAAAE